MLNRVDLPGDDSPDDVMVGGCPVCGAVVQCLRRETEMREQFGQQVACAECPRPTGVDEWNKQTCGTRVHVAKRRD